MTGVANIPETTEVEILTGKELASCDVELVREPKEHWKLFHGTQGKLSHYDKSKIAEYRRDFKKYSIWFQSNFGQSPSKEAVSASSASMVLVGYVPSTLEKRLVYKPIRDSLVFVSSQDGLKIGDPEEFKKAYLAKIKGTAAKILGVDVSTLNEH